MKKKILIGTGVVFVIIIILAASGGGKNSSNTTTNNPTGIESVQVSQYIYDIPALLGKNVDGVKSVLSEYQKETKEPTEEQIKLGVKEWDVAFEKDGKELMVTYIVDNKQVKEFFIGTDDPSGKTKDKDHLLEIGNLSESSGQYKVGFVSTLKDSSYFTGVKVIPNN